MDELLAGVAQIRDSPADTGVLEMIVARPAPFEREILDAGELSPVAGLVGDTWAERGSRQTPDGSAETNRQLTLMNSRAAHLIAGTRQRWPLAGDQLYVDLDLSAENLPPGTLLAIGDAAVEVTPEPHTGCAKFIQRFGIEAMRFVNSPAGTEVRARGINARIVSAGTVRTGDLVRKVYRTRLDQER